MNYLQYKGYTGCFTYDSDADIFHGEVLDLNDVITFQGRSIDELKAALEDSVEDYLDFCAVEGKTPEKPFSGRFNLRIPPEMHRRAAVEAGKSRESLNAWVTKVIEKAVYSQENR
jgi:predicted HicB family RNase H-like nuclease